DKAAYIFHRAGSAWIEEAKLTAPPSVTLSSDFGGSVSMSGDHVIGGDGFAVVVAPNQGASYIFRRSGTAWNLLPPPLTASDGVTYDYFGWSVAIRGDYAIGGGPQANTG